MVQGEVQNQRTEGQIQITEADRAQGLVLEYKETTDVDADADADVERWSKDGWVGAPPYFIAHTDTYHIITAPGHLFLCLSFSFLFPV